MFDGKFFGYTAVGQDILFKHFNGSDFFILTIPPDIDSHLVARSLNDAANAVFNLIHAYSEFKF